MMIIRSSTESERAAIADIHRNAFGPDEGEEIVGLVVDMFDDESAKPLLSLVAEKDARLVGHVFFSALRIVPGKQRVSARILAPLAVAVDFQGDGIGSALIEEGLKQLRESGVDLVFVLGDPGYYSRFGFNAAGKLGLQAPYPIPQEHADAWMVQALSSGVIGRAEGTVRCAQTLGQRRYWL